MSQQTSSQTGEVDRALVDRLRELQRGDDVVMSVQIRPPKIVVVGTAGQFSGEGHFKTYLQERRLPYQDIGRTQGGDYFVREGDTTVEFFQEL